MLRMLRPSRRRRHVHERLSQTDTAAANSANGDVNNNNTNNNTTGTGGSVVLIGENHDAERNGNENGTTSVGGIGTIVSVPAAIGEEASLSAAASSVGGGTDSAVNAVASSSSSLSLNSLVVPDGDGGNHNSNYDADYDSDRELEGVLQPNPTSHPFLSAQMERERFIRHRRQSTCTLLVLLFLIRLWIEALLTKDIGLIFLSMMGTLWTYRWVANRSVDEEEYDRQIINDLERQGAQVDGGLRLGVEEGSNAFTSGRDAAVNFDPDLGLLSFQAQLALAILESQRQMFENGGYNATSSNHDGPGVTEEAKDKWKTYDWANVGDGIGTGDIDENSVSLLRTSSLQSITRQGSDRSNYGSVADDEQQGIDGYDDIDLVCKGEGGGSGGLHEEPSCSICLCEYERGEKVVRLPCDHLYHEACLNSWTTAHTRCPLCNYDLMDGFEQPVSVTQQQAQQHAEEQRAFRNMALSALGRRIRTRNRTSTSGRRGGMNATATAMAVATEDSIV